MTAGTCLVCRVGAALCAIPLRHVVETLRPLPVEPLRGAAGFVRGAAILRGEPVPVVDAAALLGSQSTAPRRFVSLRVDARRVALAVDDVVGVRALPDGDLRALPPLLGGAAADAVEAISRLDGALLVLLRSVALLPPDPAPAEGTA